MQLKPEAKKIIDASDPHWVDVQPAGRFLFDFIASENPDMGRRWRFRAGGGTGRGGTCLVARS